MQERKIVVLKKLFENLLDLIEIEGRGKIDYQIKEVRRAISLLEGTITEKGNLDVIILEIQRIHKNIYPARGGLSEFYIWKDDEDERIAINVPLSQIGDKLLEILK